MDRRGPLCSRLPRPFSSGQAGPRPGQTRAQTRPRACRVSSGRPRRAARGGVFHGGRPRSGRAINCGTLSADGGRARHWARAVGEDPQQQQARRAAETRWGVRSAGAARVHPRRQPITHPWSCLTSARKSLAQTSFSPPSAKARPSLLRERLRTRSRRS